MLWDTRGCDGNLSVWNGSHGTRDSIRDICTMKKFEVGAYVVNSNSMAGSCSGYYNSDYNQDFTYHPPSNHYKSKRPSIPDAWQRQSMNSKDSLSYYSVNQSNTANGQSVPLEKHSSNVVNSVNYRSRQNSVPVQELGSDRSVDGSSSGNIYQGTMVRVKVPELYSEVGGSNGIVKESSTFVACRQEASKPKHFQQEPRNFNNQEVYGGPVPVETYRRINDWLRNCQQFSDDTLNSSQSAKSVLSSQKPHHSDIEKINQPHHMVIASKPNYGASIQSGAVSNFGFSEEPRIVAGLESKYPKSRVNENSSGHHQRNANLGWAERNDLTYLDERRRSRNFEVGSERVSKMSCTAQRSRTYFECDLSPTSSEWSSETLSITGSDKSSYCTDFTPFELGKNTALRVQGWRPASEFEREVSPVKRKNIFVSQISVAGKPATDKGAQEQEFSRISKRQLPSAHLNEKSNAKFVNDAKHDNFDSRYRQHGHRNRNSEDETGNLKVIKTNSPTRNSQVPAVNMFAGDDRSSRSEYSGYDDSASFTTKAESQTRYRQHQPMTNPENSRKYEQNFTKLERNIPKDAGTDVSVNVAKLNRDENNRKLGPEFERPRSLIIFAEKDRQLSLVRDNVSNRRQVNEIKRTLDSRPVTQLKNGSLSITIRPKHSAACEVFDNYGDPKDSFDTEDVYSQKGIREQSSEDAVLPMVVSKPSETNGTLENVETITTDGDSVLGRSSTSSQDFEKLDTFTKTIIQADVPSKVLSPTSKTEQPLKLEYKHNRSAKSNMSSFLSDAPSRFGKIDSEMQKVPIVSDFDEHASRKDNESHQFQRPLNVDENQISASCSSTVLSSDGSSKAQNVKKISVFKRIFKKARSYMGEKLGDGGIDPGYKNKSNGVGSSERENRTGPQNRLSEMTVSYASNRSKSRCKELESSEESQVLIQDNVADVQVLPNVHRYENRDQTENKLHKTSRLPFDALRSDDDVLDTRNETDGSVDTLLVSLQANRHQNLPNKFSAPQFQTLVYAPQFSVEPSSREDSQSLRHTNNYSEENSDSNSASKQSQESEAQDLSDTDSTKKQETHTTNDLDTNSANELQMLNSTAFTQELTQDYYRGLEDNECSDNFFMSDSVSLVSEVLKAFDEIQRKGKELMDSKTEDLRSNSQENADSTSTSGGKSSAINEEMSCQEFVEFHEDLVIEPPTSFSDFTIVL